MFFPYKIETLFKHWPVANWLIVAALIGAFVLSLDLDDATLEALVLGGTSARGLFTHLFLHAGIVHLAGNLLFLWVFGNAVCAMTNNFLYPLLFVVFGVVAAATHLAFDRHMAVGASGAINGVVGMALAMYPVNRVSVFWFVGFRAGTFQMPLWGLALIWFAFDAYGAIRSHDGVSHWAHLGGLVCGLATGVTALKFKWVTLTQYDNESLAELLTGRHRIQETAQESYRRRRYEALRD